MAEEPGAKPIVARADPRPHSPSACASRQTALGGVLLRFGLGLLAVLAIVELARAAGPGAGASSGRTIIRPPFVVEALAVQGDTIWAGGRDGLVAVDRHTSAVSSPPGNPPAFRYVRDILVDDEDAVWVAHQDGLAHYADGRWRDYSEADGLLPGPATAVYEDRDHAIWVGGENGVVRLAGGTSRAFATRDGLGTTGVNVIFQDRDGVMWFGSSSPTRGGLTAFDGRAWRRYSVDDGLAHNTITSIAQDRDGGLWFGTGFGDRGGASRLAGGTWTTLRREDGLPGARVRSVFQDRDGRIWFGSESDGIAVRTADGWRTLTPYDGLAGWEVMDVVQDADGVLWLGTEDGLSRLELDAWRVTGS